MVINVDAKFNEVMVFFLLLMQQNHFLMIDQKSMQYSIYKEESVGVMETYIKFQQLL